MHRFVCSTVLIAVSLAGVAPLATPTAQVTFHKDVEPILQKRCQGCHRPGEVAPMSLLSYEQVRPWAKAIRSAVLQAAASGYGSGVHRLLR
jgi:hypothetical protein